jgi:hypothetical protein
MVKLKLAQDQNFEENIVISIIYKQELTALY